MISIDLTDEERAMLLKYDYTDKSYWGFYILFGWQRERKILDSARQKIRRSLLQSEPTRRLE